MYINRLDESTSQSYGSLNSTRYLKKPIQIWLSSISNEIESNFDLRVVFTLDLLSTNSFTNFWAHNNWKAYADYITYLLLLVIDSEGPSLTTQSVEIIIISFGNVR